MKKCKTCKYWDQYNNAWGFCESPRVDLRLEQRFKGETSKNTRKDFGCIFHKEDEKAKS